jgi:hypothetical protein
MEIKGIKQHNNLLRSQKTRNENDKYASGKGRSKTQGIRIARELFLLEPSSLPKPTTEV